MSNTLKSIFFVLIFCFIGKAQYTIQSPYLVNPERAIDYVDSCATFWLQTWDESKGGFFTNIDRSGNVIYNTNKHMMTQSRNAYGLTRAFMLTGDTDYLDLAESALEFMYDHAWDNTFGGWFQELNVDGNVLYPTSNKTAFYQHYALLGIAAFVEATQDTISWDWLVRGYDHLESRFWDTRLDYLGYYDATDYSGRSAFNKSFNATVDAVTTNLLSLWEMTEDPAYKTRLQEMASEMKARLVASMSLQVIGFVEEYDSDWNWDNGETMTIMGHVLKTAWCLGRIYQIEPDQTYLEAADELFMEVWDNGYDQELGGPYKDYDRVTGQMLMWGNPDTCKASWQMEQAITAGLMLYDLSGDIKYLQMADESLDFFMTYFVDPVYGEIYADRTRYGGLAWNENKGGSGKAGYHSIELGYYTYLYGNLFLQKQPVTLHYLFEPVNQERSIQLTPLAIAHDRLRIQSVLKDDQSYSNFNATERELVIAANEGGHFEVTYEPVSVGVQPEDILIAKDFELFQNYPNPFNAKTVISYQLSTVNQVDLSIFNLLGQKVTTLVSEKQEAGSYVAEWDASQVASGLYVIHLSTGQGQMQTKKCLLLN